MEEPIMKEEQKPAKARILVVEDESLIASEIQGTLKELGYTVLDIVASGEEAIEKVDEHNPDLVLMDIVLKGEMDGIQAAEQVRAQHNIPVVYLTAYTDDKTMERAKISEPYGYIVKPFEDRELHTTIEMALYKHESEKERNRLYQQLEQKHKELQQKNRELERRVTELNALNNLFQQHLNQRFTVVEAYREVLESLQKMAHEMDAIRDWATSQSFSGIVNVQADSRKNSNAEKSEYIGC
ncbi:MAG: response regulator [Dehalococcoidia bacterium]